MAQLPSKHLLIDSYNIIHAWPELKKELKKRPRTVCELLLHTVRVIHDMEAIRLTLVVDGVGPKYTIEAPEPGNYITFLYSPGSISADGMIEHIVANSESAASVYVATQDLGLARNVMIKGAFVVTPEELRIWVDRCQSQQSQSINRAHRKSKRFSR